MTFITNHVNTILRKRYYDFDLELRLRVIVALELIDSLSDSQTTHPEITRSKEINFETGKNLSDSNDHDDNDDF